MYRFSLCFLLITLIVSKPLFASSDTAVSLSEVIVSSVSPSYEMPFVVHNINEKKIASVQQTNDVPYLLSRYPSVVAFSDGGLGVGYTGMRLRGVDITRINVSINGVPYNDAESHAVYFVNLPDLLSSSKQVKLQAGVGVSAQGTSSFGGSLAFNMLPDFENKFSLSGSLGSFLSNRFSLKSNFVISEKIAVQASLSILSTQGYKERSWVNLQGGALAITYKPTKKFESSIFLFGGKENLYLAWEGISKEQLAINRRHNPLGYKPDSSTYPNQTDNYQQIHLQWINNLRFNDKWSLHATTYYSNGQGFYEEFIASQLLNTGEYNINFSANEEENITRRLSLNNHLIGQQFLASYTPNEYTSWSLGLSGNGYIGGHSGSIVNAQKTKLENYKYFNLVAHKYDLQSFIRWEWHTKQKNIFLYADLQWRGVNYQPNGFRKQANIKHNVTYNFVNPKLGISYFLNQHKLFVSFAVGQREPVRDDFESTTLPLHEVLYDIELGHQWKSPYLQTKVNFYYMYYNNQLINTGRINDVGAYTRENVKSSYRLGMEFSYAANIRNKVQLVGNVNLSDSKINNYKQFVYNADNNQQVAVTYDKVPIAFSPNFTNFVELVYTPLQQLSIALNHKIVGKQFLDNTGNDEKAIDSYNTINFRTSYKFNLKKWGFLELQLFLNNLLGERYTPNGYAYSSIENSRTSHYAFYFPAAEQTFTLGIRWTK